ncbi:MAG: stretch-activated cation channel mid1 [Vezdaea aestivalis]|nr:MAG: stretch-activated cation channel mid1 [Vezdaea aestivalis]
MLLLHLLSLYLLAIPQTALALEPSADDSEDHNHRRLDNKDEIYDTGWADASGLSQAELVTRAPNGVEELVNNVARHMNLSPGNSSYWTVTTDSLLAPLSPATPGLPSSIEKRDEESFDDESETEKGKSLRKRQQGQRRFYISINTCEQPQTSNNATRDAPPQLLMYISANEENTKPGPLSLSGTTKIDISQGFGSYRGVTPEPAPNLYIGVHAPNSTGYSGIYNYQVAVSIDAPYHSYNDSDQMLFFVDSDSDSALLVTNNLTQAGVESEEFKKWQNITPPFTVFAVNQNQTSLEGVKNSFCGLTNYASIRQYNGDGSLTKKINASMTTRGLGNKPKQQFHLTGLNASSSFFGFLAIEGNSTKFGDGVVGGGGRVWKAMNFTTKKDGNCQVLYNLKFCSEVAYAVPSSPNLTLSKITDIYDEAALTHYKAFNNSLAQIPCETTSSAQYSLVRSCADCAAAYKQWLCAVLIPRCDDFSSTNAWLAPRNIGQSFPNGSSLDQNLQLTPAGFGGAALSVGQLQKVFSVSQSRNPKIDDLIKPGPYKEVLPCKDLCYSLVQSCPAALGFACPQSGMGMEKAYGERPQGGDKNLTCSFLGAVYNLNAAGRIGSQGWKGLGGLIAGWIMGWLIL